MSSFNIRAPIIFAKWLQGTIFHLSSRWNLDRIMKHLSHLILIRAGYKKYSHLSIVINDQNRNARATQWLNFCKSMHSTFLKLPKNAFWNKLTSAVSDLDPNPERLKSEIICSFIFSWVSREDHPLNIKTYLCLFRHKQVISKKI